MEIKLVTEPYNIRALLVNITKV